MKTTYRMISMLLSMGRMLDFASSQNRILFQTRLSFSGIERDRAAFAMDGMLIASDVNKAVDRMDAQYGTVQKIGEESSPCAN